MRYQRVTATLILLAFGLLLPALSTAETFETPPRILLSEAVLKALTETPEYTKLDLFYEKKNSEKGSAWANSPEGKAIAEVREALQKAALSSKIERLEMEGGRKRVVYTQDGEMTVLGGLVPSSIEKDTAMHASAAAIISRSILERALEGDKYQAVAAAIDAAENPPLADINRSSAMMVLGAFVEPKAPYPLWLPEPGQSTKAELLPRAEQARQQGLKAASSGDWPGAVAAFKEANNAAHCSPALMFNLALSYQRGGWSMPAAMWYRAYLAALPDASNAAEVRVEIQKLIAETETRSLGLLDEAERLTEALSAMPPSTGAKSLRQQSLESIAAYAYMVGLKGRGDTLIQKAWSLPGASNATKKREYDDKHGLYGAAYSWDAKRVEDIIARFGSNYTPEMIFNSRIYAWGNRGNLTEVRKIVDAYPSGLLSDNDWGIYKHDWIDQPEAYDILEIMLSRRLSMATKFDQKWYMTNLMISLQTTFWDGRPDIAQRLARRAADYHKKFNPDRNSWDSYASIWGYITSNSLLGDHEPIAQEMRQWKTGNGSNFVDIAALFAAASMTPEGAETTIKEMLRWEHQGPHEDSWPYLSPEAYFALAIAKNDSTRALKYLEVGDQSSKDHNDRLWRALRFAVATGRSQLAFDLSKLLHSSVSTLLHLNRLAANPRASEAVRERVSRYAVSVSGGWRPTDGTHAERVSLHLRQARALSDTEYGLMPADVEKTAKEQPEKLPGNLAGHALVLWMAALAARLED
ncbi:MAG: hypothetical protein V4688_00515 [Pseudomonadota bacterium]